MPFITQAFEQRPAHELAPADSAIGNEVTQERQAVIVTAEQHMLRHPEHVRQAGKVPCLDLGPDGLGSMTHVKGEPPVHLRACRIFGIGSEGGFDLCKPGSLAPAPGLQACAKRQVSPAADHLVLLGHDAVPHRRYEAEPGGTNLIDGSLHLCWICRRDIAYLASCLAGVAGIPYTPAADDDVALLPQMRGANRRLHVSDQVGTLVSDTLDSSAYSWVNRTSDITRAPYAGRSTVPASVPKGSVISCVGPKPTHPAYLLRRPLLTKVRSKLPETAALHVS